MPESTKRAPSEPTSFTSILCSLGGGRTEFELGARLAEVATLAEKTGKPGSVTLKITVEPNGEDSVILKETIVVKEPELSRGSSTFYLTPEGRLSTRHPNQLSLDGLQEIEDEQERRDLR